MSSTPAEADTVPAGTPPGDPSTGAATDARDDHADVRRPATTGGRRVLPPMPPAPAAGNIALLEDLLPPPARPAVAEPAPGTTDVRPATAGRPGSDGPTGTDGPAGSDGPTGSEPPTGSDGPAGSDGPGTPLPGTSPLAPAAGTVARRLVESLAEAPASDHQVLYRTVGRLGSDMLVRLAVSMDATPARPATVIAVLDVLLAGERAAEAAAVAEVALRHHATVHGAGHPDTEAVLIRLTEAHRRLDEQALRDVVDRNAGLARTVRAALGPTPAAGRAAIRLDRLRSVVARYRRLTGSR